MTIEYEPRRLVPKMITTLMAITSLRRSFPVAGFQGFLRYLENNQRCDLKCDDSLGRRGRGEDSKADATELAPK